MRSNIAKAHSVQQELLFCMPEIEVNTPDNVICTPDTLNVLQITDGIYLDSNV